MSAGNTEVPASNSQGILAYKADSGKKPFRAGKNVLSLSAPYRSSSQMPTKQASVLTLRAQHRRHWDQDRADNSDFRGWGTCGQPADMGVKEGCLPGGSSLPHPPPRLQSK